MLFRSARKVGDGGEGGPRHGFEAAMAREEAGSRSWPREGELTRRSERRRPATGSSSRKRGSSRPRDLKEEGRHRSGSQRRCAREDGEENNGEEERATGEGKGSWRWSVCVVGVVC